MQCGGVRSSGGVASAEAVKRGQQLLRVPRALLMTVDSARRDALCGPLVHSAGLNEWQTLVLHLLFERAKGESSFWAAYLATLPDQAQHPLLWGAEQLSWLRGSPMERTLSERGAQIEEDTDALMVAGAVEAAEAAGLKGHNGEPVVTHAAVRWAAATLLSRTFNLDFSDDDEPIEGDMSFFGSWQAHPDALALVPLADLVRHSSDASESACVRFAFEADAATLSAHRAYAAGEEVFSSYGPTLSAADLLMDYGYVDDAHDSHRCEFAAADVAAPASARARVLLAALEKVGGSVSRVSLSPSGPDMASLAVLRACVATDAELVRAGWRIKATASDAQLACRVMGTLSSPVNDANERRALAALSSFVATALAAYPASEEADAAEAADTGTAWLRRQVLRALLSEKQVLSGTAEAAAQWQARLSSGSVSLAELYDGTDGDGWSDENDVTWEDVDGDDDEGSAGDDGDRSGGGGRGRRS